MSKVLAFFITIFCSLNLAYSQINEVKIIKVINDIPITDFDFDLEKCIIKYTIDVLQMDAFKEKLSCRLEETNFSNFISCSVIEDVILDSRLNQLAQNLPDPAPSRDKILRIIEKVAKDKNISTEQLNQSLKKANITLDQLIVFFSNTLKRSNIIRQVCEAECSGFTKSEILRLAIMKSCFADLKLEYLSLSQPATNKGLEALKKMRTNLEKGQIPLNQKMDTIFLTEIEEKEIGENLIFLDEETTSKIWQSNNTWKMLYLHKSTMINPELVPITPYVQMTESLKMQGTLKKIFDQLENSSYVRDLK